MIHDRIGWHKIVKDSFKEKGDAKKENSRPDRDFPSAVLKCFTSSTVKTVVVSEPRIFIHGILIRNVMPEGTIYLSNTF